MFLINLFFRCALEAPAFQQWYQSHLCDTDSGLNTWVMQLYEMHASIFLNFRLFKSFKSNLIVVPFDNGLNVNHGVMA